MFVYWQGWSHHFQFDGIHRDLVNRFGVSVSQMRVNVRVIVLSATFNNISVISWWSALLLEETGVPGEIHRHAASHWQTLSHTVISSIWQTTGMIKTCLYLIWKKYILIIFYVPFSDAQCLFSTNKYFYPAMTAFTDQYSLPNIFFDIGQL